jgi:ATP-dependent DNA helicase DinG
LPACNTVILDEAHQLAETAAQFFGETLSTAQLLDLAGDTKRLAAVKAGDFPALRRAAEDLTKVTRDLRLAFPQNPVKATVADLARYDKWPDALKALIAALDETTRLLETQAERDADLKNCFERAQGVQATLASWQRDDDPENPRVRWLETTLSSLLLHATPLSVGAMFGAKLTERAQAWILTSATLSVGGDFTHLKTRLGIENRGNPVRRQPLRLPAPGRALCAAGFACAEYARLHRRRRQGGAAGTGRQPGPCVHPVHQPARARQRRAAS